MTQRKKPTWHFEYRWKRTRILVAAALSAVVVWRVAVLPLLHYLEHNVDWFSADFIKEAGYYNLFVDPIGILTLMAVVACILGGLRTEQEHRESPIPTVFAVMFAIVGYYIIDSSVDLLFALMVGFVLLPVVFFASCVVVRGLSRLRSGIAYGVLAVCLIFLSGTYYPDAEVADNWFQKTMHGARKIVNFSHYYAKRAPERMYEHTVLALANAPQLRELGSWQIQLSEDDSSFGNIVDSGADQDFLDFAYRMVGDADETPVKIFDLSDKDKTAKNSQESGELELSDATLRDLWMVETAAPGIVKNAYLVTDRQIMRCLMRVVSSPENRRDVVFVNSRPVPDIELDGELLHCFDGQAVYRFEQNAPVELVASPCMPLHGFGNYSPDKIDVLVAFMMRLWAADAVDMRSAAHHFVVHALNKDLEKQILVQLAAANSYYGKGDVAQADAAVDSVLALVQDAVLGDMPAAEMNADKRAFLTSLLASYHARKAGDAELAREYDAACLEHRARWYESDPQAGLLARTASATDSVARVSVEGGNTTLISTLGLTGGAQDEIPKVWSEDGFWLWKVAHDRTIIERASAHFGTILDSFVSTRSQEAEYDHVRKMFANNPDAAFYELVEDGMDITRYFVGAEHNGWCTYRLMMQYGEPSEGKKTSSLHSQPRYCRIDDVLMSFDEDGQPAKTWDAAGLPFHAPAVVGNVARWRGLSAEHRAQRDRDDSRDALLRLFLNQLTAGALADVESLNLDLHPGMRSFRDDQRAAMERMRLSGKDVY